MKALDNMESCNIELCKNLASRAKNKQVYNYAYLQVYNIKKQQILFTLGKH